MDPTRDIRKRDSERHTNRTHLSYDCAYITEEELTPSDQYISHSHTVDKLRSSPSSGLSYDTIGERSFQQDSPPLYESPFSFPELLSTPDYPTNNSLYHSTQHSGRSPNQFSDRSRRFGFRFDTPVLLQLQMDSDLRRDFGLGYSRQISAPCLYGEYETEPPIHIPSANLRDRNLLYPGYRYSTPLIYSSDHLGSPSSVNLTEENASQSSPSHNTSIKMTDFNDVDNHIILSSINDFANTKHLPPGENNPDASPGANLCYDYMNKGICERQRNGDVCHYRHLDANHPDAIADRFKNNLLSPEEIARYKLRKCNADEVNPFAPANAKICYDFLNKKVCSRTTDMKICRFRHLLPNHPEAIADRERTMKKRLASEKL